MAADYVSAILSSTGIQKGAGGTSPALLIAACAPLCEAIVAQEKRARKTSKRIERNQRLIDAIAQPTATAGPSPMRLPARQRQIDFRADEWRTALVPQNPINGAHYAAEADILTSPDPTSQHPG